MRILFDYLFSPRNAFKLADALTPWLVFLFFISFGYGLIGGLSYAPQDAQQGDGFRIIYVHVPAAFLSLLIYSVMAIASILILVFRLSIPFLVLKHSAVMGALFTLISLMTGSIWGKPMWGTWWIWDARLTSQLILFFVYLAILLFHAALSGKKQVQHVMAILVLVGCIDLPIIHYSVYWWNTLHQGQTIQWFSETHIAASMLYPLLSMMLAFFLYYAIMLSYSIRADLLNTKSVLNKESSVRRSTHVE